MTTQDIPERLEVFSQKQDEMMAFLRSTLQDERLVDRTSEGRPADPPMYDSVDIFPRGHHGYDVASDIADILFAEDREASKPGFDLFPGQDAFNPDKVATSIIEWLRFDYIGSREASILDPYAETYTWALSPPHRAESGKPRWSDFPQWLATNVDEDANRPFWITGKPGAGKSTMLKFLVGHPDTKKHLVAWAGQHSLDVLTYYAWSPGADLGKSMNGLLRTILCQLMARHPELVQVLCPRQWEYAFYTRGLVAARSPPTPTWVLEESLDKLLEMDAETFEPRIAIFIDGLDEFKDPPEAFCELVQKLATHRLIKVCVASREWKEFNYAFRSSPTIRMHELTEDAIRAYVTSRFADPSVAPRIERLQKLVANGVARISKLVDDILCHASGVFLWVTLVTNVVIRKVAEQEPLDVVERVMRSMPPEMEGLYDAILESIPAALLPSTAWTLLLYRYSMRRYDLDSLAFYLADESRGSRSKYDPSEKLDLPTVIAELEDRLAVRTRGILRCSSDGPKTKGQASSSVYTVHRTAAEWLDRPHVTDGLKKMSKHQSFHMGYVWTYVYLMEQEKVFGMSPRFGDYSIAEGAVLHATQAEGQEIEAKALERVMEEVWRVSPSLSCPTYCVGLGMLSFVKHKYKSSPRYMSSVFPGSTINLFDRMGEALEQGDPDFARRWPIHLELLGFLLKEGLDRRSSENIVSHLEKFSAVDGNLALLEPFNALLKKHWGLP